MILAKLSKAAPATPLRHMPTDAQLLSWFDCADVLRWVGEMEAV